MTMRWLTASSSTRMADTSPMAMPRKSTRAPGASPRRDSSKYMTIFRTSRSGLRMACVRLVNSSKRVSAAAIGCSTASCGVSKATPPSRIEVKDWVLISRPPASNLISTPLAFQKRVLWVTNWS
ncbi:hypothetical protein D3C77_539570 [compost metagenome]